MQSIVKGKTDLIWPRVLGYFLLAMLLLTLASRAAGAILLPVVEVGRPLPGALSHVVTLRGVIEAEEQRPVLAEPGLSIARIYVHAGQKVEKGEALIGYDRQWLQDTLEEKRVALQALNLQAQIDALDAGLPSGEAVQPGQSGASDSKRQALKQQLHSLESDAAQAEVDRLSQLLYSGAALTAPIAGTVTEVLVDVGDIATTTAAIKLAPAACALIVRCEVTGEQAEHLFAGIKARLQLSGESLPGEDGATLISLTPAAAGYEAVFALPEGYGAIGQTVSLTATQTTETYDMCVPLDAIVYRAGTAGVYRIQTGQSVLGEIEYAEFVAVPIRETDAQSAAIEGALLTQDQVIISSNKPVGEGDRVRSET